jgi:hypothetical protein
MSCHRSYYVGLFAAVGPLFQEVQQASWDAGFWRVAGSTASAALMLHDIMSSCCGCHQPSATAFGVGQLAGTVAIRYSRL